MKIITVTLNPCVDINYTLSSPFKAGELNRVPAPCVTYSGKGINVSRALLRMGKASAALGIFGDDGLEDNIRAEGISLMCVNCPGSLRRNTSIMDSEGVQTQINEPGLFVSEEKMREFIGLYKSELNCPDASCVIISGSIPKGVSPDIYRKLVSIARNFSAYVILDCDGEALEKGLSAMPDLIKPNREEFEALTGTALSGEGEELRISATREALKCHLANHTSVLLTLGENGSVYAGPEGSFMCEAHKTKLKTFKGAGDSFLAAFVYYHIVGDMDCESALVMASAASARYIGE